MFVKKRKMRVDHLVGFTPLDKTCGKNLSKVPYLMGFTLIEILVVVAIVGLLVSILLPALRKAKAAAKELRGMSNLRQILSAYSLYYTENDGNLLYGYAPGNVNGKDIIIHDKVSGYDFKGLPANRYPWRLSPYLSDIWDVVYSHIKPPPIPQVNDSDSVAFMKAYRISVHPTFGINATYVGGHNHFLYQGFVYDGTTYRPNYGKHVVFNASEVRKPSRLIVFADSKSRGSSVENSDEGLSYVSPPHANGHQWQVVDGKFKVTGGPGFLGLPEGRYSHWTIVGFFDCHVARMKPDELDDMRLWANRAMSSDYDFAE